MKINTLYLNIPFQLNVAPIPKKFNGKARTKMVNKILTKCKKFYPNDIQRYRNLKKLINNEQTYYNSIEQFKRDDIPNLNFNLNYEFKKRYRVLTSQDSLFDLIIRLIKSPYKKLKHVGMQAKNVSDLQIEKIDKKREAVIIKVSLFEPITDVETLKEFKADLTKSITSKFKKNLKTKTIMLTAPKVKGRDVDMYNSYSQYYEILSQALPTYGVLQNKLYPGLFDTNLKDLIKRQAFTNLSAYKLNIKPNKLKLSIKF